MPQSHVKVVPSQFPLCLPCVCYVCVIFKKAAILKQLLQCFYICILISLVVVAGGIPEVEEAAVMEGTVTAAETVATVVVLVAMAAAMGPTVVATEATAVAMEATAAAETVATSHGAMEGAAAVMAEEEEIVTVVEAAVVVTGGDMVRDTAVAGVEVEETLMEVMATKGVEPTGTAVVALHLEEVVEADTLLVEEVVIDEAEEGTREDKEPCSSASRHMHYTTELNLMFLVHRLSIKYYLSLIRVIKTSLKLLDCFFCQPKEKVV